MRQMRNRFQKLKIGIIGDGVHSKKNSKILKKLNLNFIIYKPKRKGIKKKYSKIQEIKKCDVVFIISPNNTHLNYINKLQQKSYIFCEKPPTNLLKEIKKLKKLNYQKIYFNYNFRHSKLGKIIKDIKKFNLGDFHYGNIITSHNLAQKKNYINSWRSKKK